MPHQPFLHAVTRACPRSFTCSIADKLCHCPTTTSLDRQLALLLDPLEHSAGGLGDRLGCDPEFLVQNLVRRRCAKTVQSNNHAVQTFVSPHARVAPASTTTRARMFEGSTDSRYSSDCWSNNSQHGIETTRALIFCAARVSCAANAR